MFTIICNKCNKKITCNIDFAGNTSNIIFRKGSPNIMDTMIVFCNTCGWSKTIPIKWSTSLHEQQKNKI